MKIWWEGLSARERLMLQALAAIFVVAALWFLVAAPLSGYSRDAQRRALAAETNFRLVAEAAATGGRGASTTADAATPVRTALTETALANDIAFTFINPRPDGSVEAQISAAPPERLFAMFAALEQTYGVRVASADIARVGEASPEVRAQITFAR